MIKKFRVKACVFNLFGLTILMTAISLLFSCSSLPTDETVPANLTPIELNQRAQAELDNGYLRNALEYYKIIIKRYGSDASTRTAAEYEIAHIYISQNKWLEADDMLKTIIDRYEMAGGAGLAPKYLVLARKDYKKTQGHIQKYNLRKTKAQPEKTE
ncbi:hypothetical protein [Treponema putidum]|uniref:Tetratricopeptide repeat protein n=1 Tax=Treponema putidum TaxID=221027 RepID=A0AAE9MRC2_9SPIR|nr:hypothetical protein [Treponema putidum]AIN94199.1 hypothetical protein JO40_08860 [Treponema putidum]TWI79666.1 hypothetical protein JM98_00097 [Treponema putidum]UTY28150.1 hypothetical protein E4N76_03520 [Treponema putidum]UTY30647.1 hypothetical protein E4N75_03115 [Treponema putidum]UTY33059.1 hypothetical protein E4N74_02815 [Treponema putidum]